MKAAVSKKVFLQRKGWSLQNADCIKIHTFLPPRILVAFPCLPFTVPRREKTPGRLSTRPLSPPAAPSHALLRTEPPCPVPHTHQAPTATGSPTCCFISVGHSSLNGWSANSYSSLRSQFQTHSLREAFPDVPKGANPTDRLSISQELLSPYCR